MPKVFAASISRSFLTLSDLGFIGDIPPFLAMDGLLTLTLLSSVSCFIRSSPLDEDGTATGKVTEVRCAGENVLELVRGDLTNRLLLMDGL
jgi:hypothetical protein